MVYQGLNGLAPQYICQMFAVHQSHSVHHLTQDIILEVPYTSHRTYADCSLSVAGPRLWNTVLTPEIRQSQTLEIFKKSIKTVLFNSAFE